MSAPEAIEWYAAGIVNAVQSGQMDVAHRHSVGLSVFWAEGEGFLSGGKIWIETFPSKFREHGIDEIPF